jgi:outer membrane scaffolding protein for murein synthesis (MipA/OmpV family)
MSRHIAFYLLIGMSALSESAHAGRLLDYIRNYDLNDYALGVSLSLGETPYVGAENSVFAYPYLTSFRDSAFTDDWILIREGNLGVRWASENHWELALMGRVQTLGPGSGDVPALRGLEDRKWTLELAPMVGYRGWPVHVDFKTYADILDRHGGLISELTLSLPYESSRGYIVPSVRAIQYSQDFTNYYYGVSAAEAGPLRPQYQADDATNTALKLRWGYAITDKWLLSGSIGIEFLDDEISNSPIVDNDSLWSGNIGVAYNSDIFEPRASERAGRIQSRAEFRVAAFSDSVDTKILRNASDGTPGSEIDLENLLGLPDEETILQIDAIFRFGDYHRLELGYFELERTGTATLPTDTNFGDEQFAAGTVVDSRFDTNILRLSYAYSLINDAQKELGFMAGLHFSKFNTEISSSMTGQRATSSADTPLPVVGAHGSIALGKKASLGARVQLFRMDFDRYEGLLSYLTVDLQRRFGDNFSIGLAYNFYTMKLESSESDLTGSLQIRHSGPALFVSAGF